jgi:hypothetical protein
MITVKEVEMGSTQIGTKKKCIQNAVAKPEATPSFRCGGII